MTLLCVYTYSLGLHVALVYFIRTASGSCRGWRDIAPFGIPAMVNLALLHRGRN